MYDAGILTVLAELTPWDPVAGAAATLRVTNRDDARACVLNGQTWWPAMTRAPRLDRRLFDGDFSGQVASSVGDFALALAAFPNAMRYEWAERPAKIWIGRLGDGFGSYTLLFEGVMTGLTGEGASATIGLRVADGWMDGPLLTASYAGTGGAEGVAALKGQPKPLAIGAPRYAEGVLIDNVNCVYQLHGYGPMEGVEFALDSLVRFPAPAGNDASYAALVAATIANGAVRTSTSVGMVRHGAPVEGVASYLIKGDNTGAWHRRPGAVTARLATIGGASGGQIDSASMAALDSAVPYDISLHLTEQVTVRAAVQEIAASCNASGGVNWLGKLVACKVGIAGSADLTLRPDGSSLPPCGLPARLPVDSPFHRMQMSAVHAQRPHGPDEIRFTAAIVDTGAYDNARTYREGNLVTGANGRRYLYINPVPTSGNAPPNVTYWSDHDATLAETIAAMNSVNLYRVEAAGVTSSIALSGAGISEVRFGNANGLDLTPAASNVVNIVLAEVGLVPGDVISVAALLAYSDAGGDDARLRVRFKDAAGAEVGLTTGNPQSTPLAETRFELPNLTIPAGTAAITVGSRLTGGTGAATVRNVMVNRGPICAPYSPPTRGATSNVNRGAWSSASVVYSIGDEVLSQGSTWGAKVGHISSGGNGPPSLPTTENTNWILRSAKGDAGASGTDGDPGYTLNVAGNAAKVAGQPAALNCAVTGGAWGHGSAYSSQVFVNGAALWFNTPNTHASAEIFMVGLNDNPSSATSYTDIDHALYFQYAGPGDYRVGIHENGVERTLLTGGVYRVWNGSYKYGITYDGRYVRYWEINGTTATMLYQADVGPNKSFGFDASAYNRLSLSNIAFSPKGADGAPAVIVSPPSQAYTIACNSAGTPKAGEFNKVTTFVVTQGGTDLSNDGSTTYEVANTNCAATLGGTNNKVLTQTAMTADNAKSVVTVKRSSVPVAVVEVTLAKALDGAAGRRTTDDTISSPGATTFGTPNGGPIALALDTDEVATVSFSAGYRAMSSGSFIVYARLEWREYGGTWAAMGADETGMVAAYLDDPGAITISRTLAGTGGLKIYEFRLLLRRSNITPTIDWNPRPLLAAVN